MQYPADFTPTPTDQIPSIIDRLRRGFENRSKKSAQQRIDRLHALLKLVNENESDLCDALNTDLRKSKMEAHVTELDFIRNDAWHCINNLKSWMAPEHVAKTGIQRLDGGYTVADPLGVVLIIGAWNYPIQLTLLPLVGAIAAGNTVCIKPSEIAPRTATVITSLIAKYFSPDDVTCINGGVAETTVVLAQRFDHILYTGSGFVGKIVMAAAAKNLTPVTLELGGKSPAIVVDKNVDLTLTARRIIWSKIVNAGQTCIAADYAIVNESLLEKLLEEIRIAIKEFLGEDIKAGADFARIVNDAHFKRLTALLPKKQEKEVTPTTTDTNDDDEQNLQQKEPISIVTKTSSSTSSSGPRIAIGGQTDPSTRFIEPTVIINPDLNSSLMKDEIFGPILPIITVKSTKEAIDFINARDKPLAMYIFSKDSDEIETILANTSAGGVTVNDTLLHCTMDTLPFGGVGPSGMGFYHGKMSFDLFSHKKAVYTKMHALEFANDIRYPPYSDKKLGLVKFLLLHEGSDWCCGCLPSLHTFITFLLFCAVVVLAVLMGLKETC